MGKQGGAYIYKYTHAHRQQPQCGIWGREQKKRRKKRRGQGGRAICFKKKEPNFCSSSSSSSGRHAADTLRSLVGSEGLAPRWVVTIDWPPFFSRGRLCKKLRGFSFRPCITLIFRHI